MTVRAAEIQQKRGTVKYWRALVHNTVTAVISH
jgi:hypothetical protein